MYGQGGTTGENKRIEIPGLTLGEVARFGYEMKRCVDNRENAARIVDTSYVYFVQEFGCVWRKNVSIYLSWRVLDNLKV